VNEEEYVDAQPHCVHTVITKEEAKILMLRGKRVLIKIGGASLTDKKKKETINKEAISKTVNLVKAILSNNNKLILVHGAGSFGHFEAKKYDVHKGIRGEEKTARREEIEEKLFFGFALTRASVQRLSSIFISALLEAGIPAISMSPFPQWETDNVKGRKEVIRSNVDDVERALKSNLVPVLHGGLLFVCCSSSLFIFLFKVSTKRADFHSSFAFSLALLLIS